MPIASNGPSADVWPRAVWACMEPGCHYIENATRVHSAQYCPAHGTRLDLVGVVPTRFLGGGDRYRAALEEIARRATVERNPDGVDQAAHTMQLIARQTLEGPG